MQDLKGEDIGVIAPYSAQIRHLTSILREPSGSSHSDTVNDTSSQAVNRSLSPFRAVLGDRASELSKIEVKTVDGFEGREKEVIIFSTVRSNSAGYIGFLCDWRRLNVGITRAKRASLSFT